MKGKVAIVTGAASGIGLACAERLAADGAKVVLADMNEKAGQEHARRLSGDFVHADLGQRAGCRQLVDVTLKKHGGIHVLVNNAGFQHVSPIEDFPEDQWERMLALMLTAPFLLTRYAWPQMKKQKWGRVVNIASIHALIASPFKVGYIAAKHGLVGLTRTAALEGGEHGITVNAICPAYVRTPLVDNQIADQAKANRMSPGKSSRRSCSRRRR
jgi:3-hydroxybutyrate dehydrogenase